MLDTIRNRTRHMIESRYLLIGFLFFLLAASVLRANYAVWRNCDIAYSDEPQRIGNAYIHYTKGAFSANLYELLYFAIFRITGDDLIDAHFTMRVLAPALSVSGLFVLLLKLKWVNPFGAFLAALIWNINYLHLLPQQHFGHSIVTFAFACISGALVLRKNTVFRIAGTLLAMLVAKTRPEYWIFALGCFLILLFPALKRTLQYFRSLHSPKKRIATGFAVLLVACFLIASSGFFVRFYQRLDHSLFLGFGQCYSHYITQKEPERYRGHHWGFDYKKIIRKEFGPVNSFLGAVTSEPAKAATYFLVNGTENLLSSQRLLDHRSPLFWVTKREVATFPWKQLVLAEDILFKVLFFLGMILLFIRLFWEIRSEKEGAGPALASLLVVVLLAAVSLPALLIQLNRHRYWISMIPLFFWGLAYLLSHLQPRDVRYVYLISPFIALALSPSFFAHDVLVTPTPYKDYARAVKREVETFPRDKTISVLAASPGSVFGMAAPHRITKTSLFAVSSGTTFREQVTSGVHDIVIVDDTLRNTMTFRREKVFIEAFESNPGKYGYRPFLKITEPRKAKHYHRIPAADSDPAAS